MQVDNVGQCIYSQDEIFTLMMQGIDTNNLFVEQDMELNFLLRNLESLDFRIYKKINNDSEFHNNNQKKWLMPASYKELDIEQFLYSLCSNNQELNRVSMELSKFKEYNLLNVLRYMKYMVDLFKEKHIVWGVGRGSSVASYCLFLLGCHCIDSLKYDINFDEFLK